MYLPTDTPRCTSLHFLHFPLLVFLTSACGGPLDCNKSRNQQIRDPKKVPLSHIWRPEFNRIVILAIRDTFSSPKIPTVARNSFSALTWACFTRQTAESVLAPKGNKFCHIVSSENLLSAWRNSKVEFFATGSSGRIFCNSVGSLKMRVLGALVAAARSF